MRLSKTEHGKPTYLGNLVLYGVASAAFAALLVFALRKRARPRRTLNRRATTPSGAVDAWENEGGAPAAAKS